ncbi:hypothetical protein M5D96_001397 [Drosophila gunungcola]|uniref:Mucin-5AC n=1 Tax=Drosophila gunungcola TaxID=103775 RepID=A0A9Q0BUN4_9MUSC|nr:hypothetical protein M5D96_001397 [Drosophila gunungcola]
MAAVANASGAPVPATAAAPGGGGGVAGGGGAGAQFREIHKNTWLKRLTADGKRLTVGPKKSECSWVVFCVHDDTEALLEGYAEPRQAAGHLPEWVVSLRETLHISHALIPNSHEFEFVVTLSHEVLRFHAVSWEIMQEWVETLRSKLREMKILSPRENLYTKLPEVRAPLLPTRDPTSPLPPPPPVPAALVPGMERVVATSNQTQPPSSPVPPTPSVPAPAPAPAAMSNTLTQHLLNMLSDPISTYSEQISESVEPTAGQEDAASAKAASEEPPSNSDADLNLSDDEYLPQTSRSMSAGAADKSKRLPRKTLHSQSSSAAAANSEESQDNITIIQVSNISINGQEQPPELPPKNTIAAEVKAKSQANAKLQPAQAHQEYKSNVQIIPSNASSSSSTSTSTIQVLGKQPSSSNPYTTPVAGTTKVKVVGEGEATTTVAVYGTCYPAAGGSATATACSSSTTTSSSVIPAKPQTPRLSKKIILSANTSGITNISGNDSIISGNVHYEKVFLSSSIPITSRSSPTRAASTHNCVQPVANGSPALPRRRLASPAAAQPVTPNASGRAAPQLTRGLTELLLNTPLKTKTSHKTSSATNNNIEQHPQQSTPTSSTTSAQVTPAQMSSASIATDDSQEQRRRSSSTSDAQAPLQRFTPSRNGAFRMQPPPQGAPPSSTNPVHQSPNKRLTLREQQVMQLRREIMHPGGVRLNLRRKDCVGSIAWVDAFGGVWIAGWKQKEHPVLYNALHIGDQLLSIAGVNISSAAEANKIIRNTNTLFVEVLLRRIPFGRAYAIRRDREGQCLGLIRDGNTSTIVDVVPNSLAARHGLPPKTQSCDGSSLTFWMLTEINGRSLNLFFKDLEIRDRLNSVGRDISILVQPSDLITKLKKQLKSLRGYKDYLVQ